MNSTKSVLRISIILAIILVTALFHACESEESITTDMDFLREKVVFFEDYEDYDKTLNEVLAMNEEELMNYEESRGYKSFGRASEEFYRNIKMDEFKSIDEIKSYVEENSDFLQLIEDENGELELETKFYKRADRYFLNQDNIYQIGESVYKVLEEGTVIANTKDINALTNPNNNFDYFKTDTRFKVITNSEASLPNLKNTNSCNQSETYSFRSTNGRNRLKVVIDVEPIWQIGKCHYIQRPYKRTMFVWYWCTRTMKADIEIVFECWVDNYPISSHVCIQEDELIYYKNWTSASKFEKTVYLDLEEGWNYSSGTWFDSYDIWADTYDVAYIDTECN